MTDVDRITKRQSDHQHRHCSNGSRTPIYKIWIGMKARCNRPSHKDYPKYGGRGIKVCPRWHRFENFYSDMGERPHRMSLGRKDNDGPYSPDNCEWQTYEVQNRNSRHNVRITFRGETLIFTEWCQRIGISKAGLRRRLQLWTLEEALTTPNG